MVEFWFIVGKLKCYIVSCEEIVNVCGVEDIYDGINYVRYCFLIFIIVIFIFVLYLYFC